MRKVENPREDTIEQTTKIINAFLGHNCDISIRDLAKELNLSKSTVGEALKYYINFVKLPNEQSDVVRTNLESHSHTMVNDRKSLN